MTATIKSTVKDGMAIIETAEDPLNEAWGAARKRPLYRGVARIFVEGSGMFNAAAESLPFRSVRPDGKRWGYMRGDQPAAVFSPRVEALFTENRTDQYPHRNSKGLHLQMAGLADALQRDGFVVIED